MFKQKGILALIVSLFVMILFSFGTVFAADGINWEENVITVTGMGVAPARTVNPAQARMMARRAAVVDGYRQLAESIKGVNVDAESTVENMMLVNDVVKTKVSAMIKGARVISEKDVPGGGYEVTMQVPLFGVSNSLASAVLPESQAVEAFPAPVPSVAPSNPSDRSSAAPAPSGKADGSYTGLVVDCRGLGLNPVMSPVIKNDKGEPIYGFKNLDPDKVISMGMADYAHDLNKATRAGAKPLVVKAVRLDNHNANPVIAIADANRVLIENGSAHFLDNTRVVFLR